MSSMIGFGIGIFVGFVVGFFIAAVFAASAGDDREEASAETIRKT